jgi:hypothetical protein
MPSELTNAAVRSKPPRVSELTRDSTAQPYAAAWRDYRQRRWAVAATVIGMVGLTCFGLDPSRETTGGLMFWLIAWALLITLIAWWLTWRCPRCEHYFLPFPHRLSRYGRNRCDNCGLPKWSMRDPDSDVPPP